MTGMELIRSKRGLSAELARGLGISRGAIAMWEKVPAERLLDVERITGLHRSVLRPDLFDAASPASAA